MAVEASAFADLEPLREQVRGSVLEPGDPGYDDARGIWNGMIDRRPDGIVRCTGVADVLTTVDFARAEGGTLAVRGGGHSIPGRSLTDEGLVLDLSPMRGVRVDPASRTAFVQPGARWGDFDHEAQAFGLATTGGVDSRTGVAGLTLGGGIGWLARSCGLSADNLLAADVVTADGELVRADRDENPNLLWGLRGGGGGLGVVTSFEFQLHEVGPEVLVAQAYHPFDDAADLFRFYRDYMADAPDEVGCYAFVLHVPPAAPFPEEWWGRTAAALVACHAGEAGRGRRELAPIEEFGDPILAFVDAMPYAALQQSFDAGYPDGERYYGKSAFIEGLTDDLIESLVSVADPLAGPMTAVFVESMGGAVGRVDPEATAFPHRDAPFNLSVTCGWSDPAKDDEIVSWAREFYRAIQPHSTGGVYTNYLDVDDDDRIEDAYGKNFQRLVRLKEEWDPEGLFAAADR